MARRRRRRRESERGPRSHDKITVEIAKEKKYPQLSTVDVDRERAREEKKLRRDESRTLYTRVEMSGVA